MENYESLPTVFNCYSADRWGTSFIASLPKLPAIQKIRGAFGNARNDVREDRATDKNLIESWTARHLHSQAFGLVAYALSAADLGHMLRAPKALKPFHYVHG